MTIDKTSDEMASKLSSLSTAEFHTLRLENLSLDHKDQKVRIFGWVTKATPMKSRCFVHLSSAFATVKCVIEGSHNFTFQTSMTVYGTVVVPPVKKDEFSFEIVVEKYEIYNGAQAPPFPLNEHSDKETLLNNGHLAIRMKERVLFLKARATLLRIMRQFYYEKGYLEMTPPTLVQTQVEGGATLFELDYYGEKAYMTQSSQLYLETVVPVCGKSFCIMPSYRAEKSKTCRHLSEFTHVEAEIVDLEFEDLLSAIEGLVCYASEEFYKAMLPEIRKIDPSFIPVEVKQFKRIRYADAIKFLHSMGHLKTDGTPYEYMDDIADASEKFLCAEYGEGRPVFLTHFPHSMKSFYMKKVEGELTESCDLLFPDVGETVGGSMRMDDYESLIESFKKEGLDPEPYYWYLDIAKYGPSRHGGYGLGFERLLVGLMRYKNVDEATVYPRKVNRCTP